MKVRKQIMKNKIKFYFIRAFFNGMFFALTLVNTIYAFVYLRDLHSCAHWILLVLFWIGIIWTIYTDFGDFVDFHTTNKLLDEVDKLDSEDTSVLGAQLYGKAKLEKKKEDNDLDIKMLHDLEKKKR